MMGVGTNKKGNLVFFNIPTAYKTAIQECIGSEMKNGEKMRKSKLRV